MNRQQIHNQTFRDLFGIIRPHDIIVEEPERITISPRVGQSARILFPENNIYKCGNNLISVGDPFMGESRLSKWENWTKIVPKIPEGYHFHFYLHAYYCHTNRLSRFCARLLRDVKDVQLTFHTIRDSMTASSLWEDFSEVTSDIPARKKTNVIFMTERYGVIGTDFVSVYPEWHLTNNNVALTIPQDPDHHILLFSRLQSEKSGQSVIGIRVSVHPCWNIKEKSRYEGVNRPSYKIVAIHGTHPKNRSPEDVTCAEFRNNQELFKIT